MIDDPRFGHSKPSLTVFVCGVSMFVLLDVCVRRLKLSVPEKRPRIQLSSNEMRTSDSDAETFYC